MPEKIEGPEPTDKDELIRTLRAKLVSATRTLKQIDLAIRDVAKKYLVTRTGSGFLPFEKFIDLLVIEIRREERAQWKDSETVAKALKAYVGDQLEERLDAMVYENLPKLRGVLADHLTLQVLILPSRKKFAPDGQPFHTGVRACSIRGKLPQGVGPDAEAAYQDLRERLAIFLYNNDQREFFYHNLMTKDGELARIFEHAQPYKTDQLEGYKIEVRQVPGKDPEKK